MKIHFLSFASPAFYDSLKRIGDEANKSGFFDTVNCIRSNDLPLLYRLKNIFLLNRFTRGYGYWMWKSYVVKLWLGKIAEGDILMYADAGCTINVEGKARFYEYIDMLVSSDYSNLSFQLTQLEKEYTKGDLLKYLGFECNEAMKNSGMLVANVFFLKKDSRSVKLIEEWYSICHFQRHLLNDSPSGYPNDPAFVDHRHDQSVFSLLRKSKGSLILTDEVYFENWDANKRFPMHTRRFR